MWVAVRRGWASSKRKFSVGFISFVPIFVWEMQHENIHTMTSISTNKILNAPELHIAIFAFLLNFVWELLQMPLGEPSTASKTVIRRLSIPAP